MRKLHLTTCLFSSLVIGSVSFTAQANAIPSEPSASTMSNFNYDYIDARIGVSPMTFGAAASMSIHPNAHAYVLWESEFDDDYNFAGGVGFHAPVNNWADITGDIHYRIVDNRTTFKNDSGVDLNFGWRQWVSPQIELGAKVGYYKINNDLKTDEFYGNLYGRFYATELFSIAAEGKMNDIYGDQLMFSARFKY